MWTSGPAAVLFRNLPLWHWVLLKARIQAGYDIICTFQCYFLIFCVYWDVRSYSLVNSEELFKCLYCDKTDLLKIMQIRNTSAC
jgi:hypothetical protein